MSKENKKVLLFDMDGVLVDVSSSYRKAIQETVKYFSNEIVSFEKIQSLKNSGGLNNDWDLTEAILNSLNIQVSRDKIIEVFQKYYLGENFNGFIQNEIWLAKKEILQILSQDFNLGVVTGRPQQEAIFSLKQNGVLDYFSAIITMEDVTKGKPDPEGILKALKLLKCSDGYYVGDSVDDMKAALQANLIPIAFVNSRDESLKQVLQDAGSIITFYDFEQLTELNKIRIGQVNRVTKETSICANLYLDGKGNAKINTEIGFFDHMLEAFTKHGMFNLSLQAKGDLHVDQHHLVEDCGLVLGKTFSKALKNRKGINRTGFFIFPMDEALSMVAIDLGGRPYLQYHVDFKNENCGELSLELLQDFFQAFAVGCQANVAIRALKARSDHHKVESIFKALGKALKMAVLINERDKENIPSTKGVIDYDWDS